MGQIKKTEVIINNKRYLIRGYEGDDYIQKIASYVNSKHKELKKLETYKFIDTDTKHIMVEINIADDYLKAQKSYNKSNEDIKEVNQELFDLRHENISLQAEIDKLKKDIEDLKKSKGYKR